MLSRICHELSFFGNDIQRHFGLFKIEGGSIEPLSFLKEGQYFWIKGSVFNDGLYEYPACNLIDEKFDGAIWAVSFPQAFLDLVEDIKTYCASEEAKPSNLQSESFGGYSYSKATKNGVPITWKQVFKDELNNWRKMRCPY